MSNRKSGCIHDHSSLSNVFATQASKSFKCCCSWKESHQKLSFSSLSKLSTVKDRVNNYTQNLPHPHTAAPCLLTSIFNSQPNGVSRKYFRTRGLRERGKKQKCEPPKFPRSFLSASEAFCQTEQRNAAGILPSLSQSSHKDAKCWHWQISEVTVGSIFLWHCQDWFGTLLYAHQTFITRP